MDNVRQEAKSVGGTFEGEAIADLFVPRLIVVIETKERRKIGKLSYVYVVI